MGIVELVKAVMWARKRQPQDVILQGVAAAAETDDLALQSSREWKGTLATAVVVMNVSGADPLGTVRLYGDHVLPELRG